MSEKSKCIFLTFFFIKKEYSYAYITVKTIKTNIFYILTFREYIAYEYSFQFISIDWTNISIILEKNIPQQENGIDCGIFVCEYAENLARNSKFEFTQKDTDFIRERIKMEVILSKLIQDPINM